MSKLPKIVLALTLFLWGYSYKTEAQDLEQIKNYGLKKGVKISGGLNVNTVYNSAISNYSNPINYFVSGIVNFKVFGFDVPVSINYSNRVFSYSQPFTYNYVSVNPRYKWANATLGTTFMSFSPYTLNGHQFTGAGLTLTPKHWNVRLMYGRLLQAQEANDSLKIAGNYRRMAWGIKTQYKADKWTLGFTAFHANDDENSLLFPPKKLPQAKQNLVLGLDFETTLIKNLQLNFEYTSSALILDKRSALTETLSDVSLSGKFLPQNPSMQAFNALKTGINYRIEASKSLIGVQYERVEPNYQTLGAYYFVNDFENVTTQFTQELMGGKLNFNGSLGLQHDDLFNKNSSQQNRVVGAAQLNYVPNKKLNLGLLFSNFTAYKYIKTAFDEIRKLNPYEQIDTLNYKQITHNISGNFNYLITQDKDLVQSLSGMVTWMESVNIQGNIVRQGQLSTFTNGNFNYVIQKPKQLLGLSGGINLSQNTIGTGNSISVGPMISIQKGLFENTLNTQMGISYIYTNDETTKTNANALNIRANATCQWQKKHQIVYNLGFTNGKSGNENSRNYLSMTLGYGFKF